MPFPNRKIEEAYDASRSIVQGFFKDDKEVLEVGGLMQQCYNDLQKRCDDETMNLINALLELSQETKEYQCRHVFTEGWLAASGQSE